MIFTIHGHDATHDACGATYTSRFPEERRRWQKNHPETCTAVRR